MSDDEINGLDESEVILREIADSVLRIQWGRQAAGEGNQLIQVLSVESRLTLRKDRRDFTAPNWLPNSGNSQN